MFRLPFPRRFLIRLHNDLFTIDRHIDYYASYPTELSIFEKSVLISEDRRYLTHSGCDYISVCREVLKFFLLKKHGGASTIDMQFVRTCTGYYEISVRRKLYEITLSLIIQFRYSKIVILRSYLKCAFFGSGLQGANHAAMAMFQKSPSALDLHEAATIASMLVYPKPLIEGKEWVEKINRRSDYICRLYPTLKQRFEKIPSWDGV